MNTKRSSKREKRGVSPVLATMIMVGVAVAVGLGVASYTMGLFGNLARSAQISVTSVDIDADDDEVTFTIENKGGLTATLDKVEVTIDGTIYSAEPGESIGASASVDITVDNLQDSNDTVVDFESGKSYTFTLKFSDGKTLVVTGTAA
ncbi:MAG: type IV pilin [Candidatus Nitrosothermus koennekii]|nr:MAG: type IV pilin [Candidatus Nitrosothermus koennekii]